MSKFYHFNKNFTFKEIMNLLTYNIKHPETLSSNQKITRLYRSTLRKFYATQMEGIKTEHDDFNRSMALASKDFHKMMTLPHDSTDLKILFEKWEKWHADNYDPAMVVDECRPYSSGSARYPIWSDDALKFDPFGFYSKNRLTAEKRPGESYPYYEAYPYNNSLWNAPDTFGPGFDDTNYEKIDAMERNQKKK